MKKYLLTLLLLASSARAIQLNQIPGNTVEPSSVWEAALGNPSSSGYVLSSTTGGVRSWIPAGSGSGDFSTNTTTSVVDELVLFADTTGKLGKRSTGTGILKITSGVASAITDNSSNWDTAYTDRLKWDGGSTGLTASTGRTSLGATTVGSNLFTLTNPSAITFIRLNADNSVSALDASTFRTAIGAGTGSGDALTSNPLSQFASTTSSQFKGVISDENAPDGASSKVIMALGSLSIASGKTATFSNTLTFAGTDSSTLDIGSGGTLGSNAFTSTAYVPTSRSLTIGPTTADLSADRTFLGNVTNDAQTKAAVVPNTAPSLGQILIGNSAGTAYAKKTVSGSGATISLDDTGLVTISGIANTSLSNSSITIGGTSTALGGSVLGNVTNDTQTKAAIVPNTAPSSGQILIGNSGGTAYAKQTISGSGATISLNDTGVITLSAIPNATLSNSAITIGGASTALGGSVTATTILDSISSTQGTVLYRGASSWSALAVGTDGYQLTTHGASANPTWEVAGSGSSGANPTASVGLSAVNGSASTFLRSDGAPALDVSISPTWTGTHTWQASNNVHQFIATGTLGNGRANPLVFDNETTNTPANGLGNTLKFLAKDSTTSNVDQCRITSKWTDVTHATRKGDIGVQAYAGAGIGEEFRVYGAGGATLGVDLDTTIAPGVGVLNAETGIQINSAGTSGKVLQGNGTNYVPSTPTWPTSGGTAGTWPVSNGTNFTGGEGTVVQASGTSSSGTPGTTVADLAASASHQLVAWTIFTSQASAANTQTRITVTYSDATTCTATTTASTLQAYTANAGGITSQLSSAFTACSAKVVTELKVDTQGSGTGARNGVISALQVPR